MASLSSREGATREIPEAEQGSVGKAISSPASSLTFGQETEPLTMRNILTAVLLLSSNIFGSEWVITKGGLSPDKKFAVAVFPQKTEFIDEADDTVLLIDQTSGRRIGPLEEVSSSGGTWGSTTTNVHCVWSPDSTILVVNFRTGRLMHSSQIYRIRDRRAIPLSLPETTTHPKGKLLEGLQSTANPGSEVTLTKDGFIRRRGWGYVPDFTVDYSKHGLTGFEGELLFEYRFDQQGHLHLHDITVPSAP
jgi:hypothetical protein